MKTIAKLGFDVSTNDDLVTVEMVFDDNRTGDSVDVTTAKAQFLAFIWNGGWELQWDPDARKFFVQPIDQE
jgi:hypothetical protein